MAREIYNKNAREKALLEEAYMQVYTERDGKLARGAGYKGPLAKLGDKAKEIGGKIVDKAADHLSDTYSRMSYDHSKGDFDKDLKERKKKQAARRKKRDHEWEYNRVAPGIEDYESEEGNTLEAILPTLEFKETTKQAKEYEYIDLSGANPQLISKAMPAMSYTVATEKTPVVTITSDGKETQNVAEPNDIIMSGPSREQYVVKPEKFIGERGLYTGKMGGTVTPEQSPRIVARVENITQPVTFKAPWGEDMILKRGDYLVKDGDQGYYRIAQKEYDETYNAI